MRNKYHLHDTKFCLINNYLLEKLSHTHTQTNMHAKCSSRFKFLTGNSLSEVKVGSTTSSAAHNLLRLWNNKKKPQHIVQLASLFLHRIRRLHVRSIKKSALIFLKTFTCQTTAKSGRHKK